MLQPFTTYAYIGWYKNLLSLAIIFSGMREFRIPTY